MLRYKPIKYGSPMTYTSPAFNNVLKKMGFSSPYQRETLTNMLCKTEEIERQHTKAQGEVEPYTLPTVHSILTAKTEKDAYCALREFTQHTFKANGSKLLSCLDEAYSDPYFTEAVKKLHLLDTIRPAHTEYVYAIILGATEKALCKRINYEKYLHDHGVTAKHVVLLGDYATESGLMLDMYQDIKEITLQKRIKQPWKYMAHRVPEKDTTTHYQFQNGSDQDVINIGALPKPDNARATTFDTIEELVTSLSIPKGARLLFITHQPHVAYQEAVIKNTLNTLHQKHPNKEYKIEVVGPESPPTPQYTRAALDALARRIYEAGKQDFPELYPELAHQPRMQPAMR